MKSCRFLSLVVCFGRGLGEHGEREVAVLGGIGNGGGIHGDKLLSSG